MLGHHLWNMEHSFIIMVQPCVSGFLGFFSKLSLGLGYPVPVNQIDEDQWFQLFGLLVGLLDG